MALNQEDIDVGAAPNDGQGDPIRTAFIKCNDNFTQLYSLPNPTPPTTLIGAPGDMPGMYAYDDTYFYYCYDAYNGVSTVWGQLVQSDEAIPSIGNGLSNVVIAFANANVTVGVNGTGNVGVFSPAGLAVRGAVNSNTIATGSLVSGNFTIAGDTISSIGDVITITPAGNVIFADVVVNSSLNIRGPRTTTDSKVIVLANTAANAAAANLSGIQIGSANYASFLYNTSNNHWFTSGSITAWGFNANAGNVNNINFLRANTVLASVTVDSPIHIGNEFFGNLFTGGLFTGNGAGLTDITGANVTGTVANAAYSIQSNNSTFAGTVTTNAQPNITTVGILSEVAVSGLANLASVIVSNTLQVTGNISTASELFVTGNTNINGDTNIIGNTNIGGNADISGNVQVQDNVVVGVSVTAPVIGSSSTVLNGVISVASNSQPNITTLGTITNLFAGNVSTANDIFCGGSLYANSIVGNISGSVDTARFVTNNVQSNITRVGTLNTLSVANGIVVTSGELIVAGNIVADQRIFAPIIGNSISLIGGKFGANSNAQPNITSLGNLTSVNVTGPAIFGTPTANATTISGNTISSGTAGTTLNLGYNVIIPGNLQVQGNTTTVNSNTVAINDLTFVVANNASTSTLANGAGIFVGPEPAHYAGFYYVSATNSWNMDLPLNVSGNVSATSVNWANGNPIISTSGNFSAADITASNANFTGNVTAAFFNGVATSAQYADLAENYLSDLPYQPGTVVSFGGDKEVTVSTVDLDRLVAGVVSTNPAYTMNSGLTGDYTIPVALMGRVPCRVSGAVTRGAMMVSNGDGTARAEPNPVMGSVLGKALESFDGATGVIEIVVGKL
jgi:hypothetical protein